MKKKKINFKKYADMHEETELVGKDGTSITVRNHISYTDKVQMAKEVIENCVMIHDDSCCYESYMIYAEKIKAMMKYYTDVPVDDVSAEEVADFVINNDLIDAIQEYIHNDYYQAEDVYVTMMNMVMDTYADDMSLKKAIKTSFGFLFNGEDITESLAKAEMTKDTMFKALDAINKKEKEVNGGELTVGGKILNFAKRE
jgi:hypothetical protein